jgi:energy-coupling factor transport system ATP-binding protein
MAVTGASEPRHAGSLHPGELAHAAAMAALCVASAIIAAAVPSLWHLIIGGVECRR